MSELISIGILICLLLWGYGCYRLRDIRDSKVAGRKSIVAANKRGARFRSIRSN